MSTGGAAGRRGSVWSKSPALGIALAALAVAAPTALATTDRADYAAQASPICASANAQAQQLSDSTDQRLKQIHRKLKRTQGRKHDRLLARDRKLSSAFPGRLLRIRYSELAALRSVPAAPGDEGLVSSWLGARKTILDLTSRANQLERRIDRLLDRFVTRNLQLLNQLDQKVRKLDHKIDRVESKLIALESTEADLGTELGATDCVNDVLGPS